MKYRDYVCYPPVAHRRKEHERRVTNIPSMLENDNSGYQGQQPSTSTATPQDDASIEGQTSPSYAGPSAAEDHEHALAKYSAPAVTRNASAPKAAMAVSDVNSDSTVVGPPLSSKVQHSYQLQAHISRPPKAFVLLAQEKRRSVAMKNPNENNQRVSRRLVKEWHSFSDADKEPYQSKAAEVASGSRRKYPDYGVYNIQERPTGPRNRSAGPKRLLASSRTAVLGISSSSLAAAKGRGTGL
nr:transcription factor Sox-19a-like [Dermacentor andersoni]